MPVVDKSLTFSVFFYKTITAAALRICALSKSLNLRGEPYMKNTLGNRFIYFQISVGIGSLCMIITGFIVFRDLERRGSNTCFIHDTILFIDKNKFFKKYLFKILIEKKTHK